MIDKVEAVQSMQEYIEKHLSEDISLAELAQIAHFSPWYSARIFKELTKLSPAHYIRRLRLSKSALRLRDENIKVIDIAFAMGFASVDGYQRAFYREFGYNPKEYANKPVPLSLFIPYGVKFKKNWKKEKSTMESNKEVSVQVIEKAARKVIIKRGLKAENYFEYCQELGGDVWGILTSMKSPFDEPVCLWLPESYIKANSSKYVQGVEVALDYKDQIPDGFDIIELPKAKYLRFQGKAFAEENYCEAIEALQEYISQYDPSIHGYVWDNNQPQIQLEPIGTRGYIELKAVK